LNLNPFKKINTNDIKLAIADGKAVFSYVFEEKQERQINIAAGKIHRGIATAPTKEAPSGWSINGFALLLMFNLKSGEWRTHTFGEISDFFEEMIK
jgi:nucleoside 2-deoxyribosyltransferase